MGISSQVHGIAWSLSYSDSRSSHGDEEDDEPHSDKVVTLSLSVPLSHLLPGSYAGYTLTSSRHSVGSQMVSLNGTLLDNHALSYAVSQTRDRQNGSSGSLTAGYSSGRGDLNLGYSHDSQAARLNYGASGGILIHRHGVVFTPEMNGAVVLIDAGGAGGVTLANQKTIATNGDGYAVLPFATAYHRNDVSLDSHSLPENVDLANSTVTLVPTKDAVVLARFHTHVGYKALFTLQSRGQPLPFGSEVRAKDTSSIVASEGQVYLAGLAPKGTLYAQWGPGPQQHCTPATISPRRWRRHPIHSFYSRRYHVLFNSPASGRPDAVIYSVTGRQRMGLYASVCPRPGLHPSAERGAAHGSG
jgi:outer membrane usher protein